MKKDPEKEEKISRKLGSWVSSSDSLHFLMKFLKEPEKIGALLPSSRFLAKALTKQLMPTDETRIILETGPGTGPVTQAIVRQLKKEDRLDLLEKDEEFAEKLTEKFCEDSRVSVHRGSIIDWQPGYRYNAIISSLPFHLFPPQTVEVILEKYRSLCNPGGTITYFEYIGIPKIKKLLLKGEGLAEYLETLNVLHRFTNEYEIEQKKVWSNVPPALVHYCKLPRHSTHFSPSHISQQT